MFTRKRSAFCKRAGRALTLLCKVCMTASILSKKASVCVQAMYRCQEAHNGFVVLMHMPETGSLATFSFKAVCTHTLLKIAKRLIHHYDSVFTSFGHH